MNSKMTTNSQLSTTEPKTQKQKQKTKQTTRTRTELQKWRSHGGLSAERERGVKEQRISSIDDKWKIDRGRVKIV